MITAIKRFVVLLASVGLLTSGFAGAAGAAMVGTRTAVDAEQRAAYAGDIQQWLGRDQVRRQLVDLGVDPAKAAERVEAMTTAELRAVHERIDELPAGGVVEVIGIVFVVLLVLELVGVTNIFTRI